MASGVRPIACLTAASRRMASTLRPSSWKALWNACAAASSLRAALEEAAEMDVRRGVLPSELDDPLVGRRGGVEAAGALVKHRQPLAEGASR